MKECWASLFEARAIFYRVENGFEHMKVKIAVPVQKMVQSERSGVMFTVEPVTSDRSKITVEAIVGLGEALVSGEISPDMYIVDKESLRILEKHIADQDTQLARTAVRRGQGAWPTSPGSRYPTAVRSSQKLTDEEIVKVAEIGKRIEEHYGFPQDIEWARENREIFIVQTRPVTTLQRSGRGGGEGRGDGACSPQGLRRQPGRGRRCGEDHPRLRHRSVRSSPATSWSPR